MQRFVRKQDLPQPLRERRKQAFVILRTFSQKRGEGVGMRPIIGLWRGVPRWNIQETCANFQKERRHFRSEGAFLAVM